MVIIKMRHSIDPRDWFKTTMLKPRLCDYNDAYILYKGRIKTTGRGHDAAMKERNIWKEAERRWKK